jgi:hypothetical protein
MNTPTRARGLCGLALKRDPKAGGGLTIHTYDRGRRSVATSRQSIAITHQRNRHGATSLATVAKGVCLHHEHYLTS